MCVHVAVPGNEVELDVAVDLGVASKGRAVVHFNQPRLHLVVDEHVKAQQLEALARIRMAQPMRYRSVRVRKSRLSGDERLDHECLDRAPQFL